MIKKEKVVRLIENHQIVFTINTYNEQLESKLQKNVENFKKNVRSRAVNAELRK